MFLFNHKSALKAIFADGFLFDHAHCGSRLGDPYRQLAV